MPRQTAAALPPAGTADEHKEVTPMLRHSRPRTTAGSAPRRLITSRLAPLRRDSEGGQAVVELALALPILLVVVLGIVDFGRAINYWNDETHIANLAARYAAVGHLPEGGTCGGSGTLATFTKCEAAIDSPELEKGSTGTTGTQGSLNVCVSIPKPTVGEPVEVKVSTQYSWLPLPKVLGGKYKLTTTGLSGSATMRLEQVPPAGFATTTSKC